MSDSDFLDAFEKDSEGIESMVFAARHYVQASDDLRPRVLEAAKQYCGDRHAERKLGSFVIMVMVALIITSPLIDYATTLRSAAFPRSASEMQQRAADLSTEPGVGTHWALADVFSQWRMLQASRLGQSTRRMK